MDRSSTSQSSRSSVPRAPQVVYKHPKFETWLLIVLFLSVLGVSYLGYNRIADLETAASRAESEAASSTAALTQQADEYDNQIADLQGDIDDLENDLDDAEDQNDDLRDDLDDELDRNDELQEQVEEVTDSVGNLQNTVDTDPELLKKYSRTFFLSENYVPSGLVNIPDKWTINDRDLQFHERAWDDLEDLLEDAEDDGIDLRIVSAYRSFGTQRQLNDRYTVTYGAGTANQFSAEQGYSEHQLGTTIDFSTESLGANFGGFETTEAYQWLQQNGHEYGFVLSYPEGNGFYQFEPWHWRFVGKELAEDIDDENADFYDWSQREIDTYRSELFD